MPASVQKLSIIDYGAGNLRSAEKAIVRVATAMKTPLELSVTNDPDVVREADRIILPGVGAFGDCREGLWSIDGMAESLNEHVQQKGKPFLGICVGMQLMAKTGHEKGEHQGFGWLDGEVHQIEPSDPGLKIPHMGWNTLDVARDHPLLDGIETGKDGLHAYFVHSYHMRMGDPAQRLATSDYGGDLTAMVAKDNMVGTQFHPEKSQMLGLKLIDNFMRWTP